MYDVPEYIRITKDNTHSKSYPENKHFIENVN